MIASIPVSYATVPVIASIQILTYVIASILFSYHDRASDRRIKWTAHIYMIASILVCWHDHVSDCKYASMLL